VRSFASDNNAGVCQEIIEAILKCNTEHVVAYGDDHYTELAKEKFKSTFGPQVETFFVFNGTAANVLSINFLAQRFNAVICADTAHIATDECGAPEAFTGCKLLTVSTPDGKLTPELLKTKMGGRGDQHHVQPKVISITQSTELGTVYSIDELKRLTKFAHDHDLAIHMDGARISNAAAFLGCDLKEISTEVGIDVLSFGGTKNAMMGGEAVVFLNTKFHDRIADFKFMRKQAMQLSCKMRFVAVQFEALLTNDLWKKNAGHANQMAQKLVDGIKKLSQIEICYAVQANGVFVQVPKDILKKLQEKYFFYVWNEEKAIVRWMTSFDTTESDIETFLKTLKSCF
jgi:threonine aldolase